MSEVITNGIETYFLIVFNLISDAFFNFLDTFIEFFFSALDTGGQTVVSTGDILCSHLVSLGVTSYDNFVFVFVGFVFVAWAVKASWKIVTKIIEIIGNFTPFT